MADKQQKMDKKEEVSTITWVLWILIAIIGVAALFTGLQNSVAGNNITVSTMCIVIGIILLFVALAMILGEANIQANKIEMPKKNKEDK